MARRQTLPQVSPKVATELRPLVTAIKEIIETGEGVRGDPLDRKLTLRDLLDSGIGALRAGASANTPNALVPSPAPPNLATPPQPTGFNATGGFDGRIDLTWTVPGSLYSNHAYTNIYRAEADNFANAILVGREAGAFYTDIVRDDVVPTPYYYWISFTSTSDIEGPLNATAGTLAQAVDIDWLVGELEGKISESELAAELLTPIQAIPSIQTTLADHTGRISATEAALSDLLNVPAFDSTATYAIDDLVSYNGFTWRALVAMSDPVPTPVEGANWTQVGQYVTFSDIIAANSVAIDDLDIRITTSEGTLTSYGTDITALQNRVTDTETATSGNSSAIGTLDSRVTFTEGNITTISSDITLLQNDITTAQGDITANSGALNLLDSAVQTLDGTVTAQATDISQAQSAITVLQSDTTANASGLSSLTTRVTQTESDLTATATRIDGVEATADGAAAAVQTKAEAQTVTDLQGEVTTVKARYSIQLDVNNRMSGLIFGDNGTESSLVIASNSMFFIDPGQSITPFNPGTNYTSMDVLRDTQFVFGYATVEGLPRFVINVPAYIPEGYIESGMVGAISFGKITDSQGNPVTTVGGLLKADNIDVDNLNVSWANITNANIQNADIANAAITNAKIQDAAITEAKIQDASVDTLKIRGNAVTVPATATGVQQFPFNFLRPAVSVTVTLDEECDVGIWWTFEQGYSGGGSWGFRVVRDSLVLSERVGMGAINDYPSSFVLDENVPAGTRTYRLDWAGGGNITATGSIYVLGVMR